MQIFGNLGKMRAEQWWRSVSLNVRDLYFEVKHWENMFGNDGNFVNIMTLAPLVCAERLRTHKKYQITSKIIFVGKDEFRTFWKLKF